jgi:hypothetical protein
MTDRNDGILIVVTAITSAIAYRWAQSDNAGERRRDACGSAGIATESASHDPGGYRNSGTSG